MAPFHPSPASYIDDRRLLAAAMDMMRRGRPLPAPGAPCTELDEFRPAVDHMLRLWGALVSMEANVALSQLELLSRQPGGGRVARWAQDMVRRLRWQASRERLFNPVSTHRPHHGGTMGLCTVMRLLVGCRGSPAAFLLWNNKFRQLAPNELRLAWCVCSVLHLGESLLHCVHGRLQLATGPPLARAPPRARAHTRVTCAICYEEVLAESTTLLAGCGHQFCTACIEQWTHACRIKSVSPPTCPMCRAPFRGV